ncbi:LOW QUALITY PROTEIN: piwi-like protein Ago3 [Haliotis rubra]|uniref:LOW QUALITY PROTEIN: piwi-like protein Ago3 n=1 Tax=Haliotis rubra TaxID=36100 RepID=UPI001EE61B5E|nr:LOW QUALITY PROTEIN: piwi-like protein Ago3 [Haliotis rubra]
MASGGFYGRGGRGRSILDALKQPARKPGQQEEQAQAQAAAPITPQSSDATPKPPAAPITFGRGGGLLAMMQKAQPSSQPGALAETTAPKPAPAMPFTMPIGRGLGGMKELLQKAAQGRGMPAPSQVSSRPSTSGSSTSAQPPAEPVPSSSRAPPHPSAAGAAPSPAPPSEEMSRLAIYERREAVHRSGSEGKVMPFSANHIRVKCKNSGVFQYDVKFDPVIDSKGMRIGMLNEHKAVIGQTKAFDGRLLFLPIRLPQTETVLHSQRKTDGINVTITIRLTTVVDPTQCAHLYNIVFRRIMSILDMCQVGRYYYNPHTPSQVPQHKLEVWPGYISSIKEQEGGLLLNLDASHRVLRTETVLDVMCQYRKNYNISIRDAEQPLLINRPRKKREPGEREPKIEMICLVPELCYMTGLTDEMRSDFRLMKDIAVHTRVTPMQRIIAMKKFIRSINTNDEARKQLENWGLELETETIRIEGRLLKEEKIKMRQKDFMAGPEADFGRDVTRSEVLVAVDLRNWIVLYTKKDTPRATEYIQMMKRVCPQMGIQIQEPLRRDLKDDRTETFVRNLRESVNPRVQMVVVICPTSRDDRYSAIKKFCCVECPVPSQVIISKTIGNPNKLRSVTQKIALQMNCKLGGELWAVEIPLKDLMIVGIDVYHDATKGKRSIAGFVASTNRTCTRWFSRVHFQLPHEELVNGLKTSLLSALRTYHEINHKLPEKIIVYRDGVGDGQLKVVSEHEVKQLATCFKHFPNYEPKLSVVVVQKRINTRLFYQTGPDRIDNPPPGSVMDHTITRRDWYDFFLVSQHVRQGTVSPTHYIVVHDGSSMKPDHMQRLAYKMTHMYYNWPGTVRVPAPCQYAHKLAYLVGQSIHKEPSELLSDRLFFL